MGTLANRSLNIFLLAGLVSYFERNLIDGFTQNALKCSIKYVILSGPQIEGTQKLLNKDLAELISKMRLAQQNAVTSLKDECKKQMLTAAHTLAMDSKNLLDAVDQARVRANIAKSATP